MSRSFDACLVLLTDGSLPRVWSLIVTIFGDMAQGDGDTLSSQAINRITDRIGIKPAATRVALHRLKADGWLWSRRQGRTSDYGLTETGRAESALVSPRIYGQAEAPRAWHLVIANPDNRRALETLIAKGSHLPAMPGIAVGAGAQAPTHPDLMGLPTPDEAPDWLRSALCDPRLRDACHALLERFTALRSALPEDLSPCETAALRVLIVHDWRRLVLRVPDLPEQLFPTDWAGPQCRALLSELLERLPAPDAQSLAA
ncbi:MAG: PaaX family transcriptional regulator [Rhodobacterales bacterium]|nr:MAG: PaaX family transcriptional regulator [Rhodobacterales bacterium]